MAKRIFTNDAACKRLGIKRTSLSGWAQQGCPVPPLQASQGPLVGKRNWTSDDIKAALAWKKKRAEMRSFKGRRGEMWLQRLCEQVTRQTLSKIYIHVMLDLDSTIPYRMASMAITRHPKFGELVRATSETVRQNLLRQKELGGPAAVPSFVH